MSNIIPLPTARGASTRLDLFLRLGETHYAQAATLYAEGKLPVRRAIFDASKVRHQLDFLKTLRDDGVELSLDTKAAELGALTRYQGHPSGAPWSGGTLHLPAQFDERRCREFTQAIAGEAVARGFDRVLSPSHFLAEGVLDPWFQIDVRLCKMLRDALDRAGGKRVVIDYGLIIGEAKLRDEAVRSAVANQLASLPFENLVLRASNFGADATAPKLRNVINMLDRFAAIGHPVVVDHVGGLAGRALLAFGVAGGVAHGLDEHLRFDATPWNRPPNESAKEDDGRRGAAKRVSLVALDRSLTVPELNALARAKNGHRLVVCQDPNCCRSLSDMVSHSRRHAIVQELNAMSALNRVPDLMRAQHFLEKEVADADRFARQVKDLKPIASELKPRSGQTQDQAAVSLSERLAKQAQRNEKIRSSLENLHSVRGLDKPRAPAAYLSDRVRSASGGHRE